MRKPRNLHGSGAFEHFLESLALGELGRAAGGLEAVLLTLFHSRIAGQKTSGLQQRAVLCIDLQQRAGNAVANGAGLAGHAAAGDGADNVNLAQRAVS